MIHAYFLPSLVSAEQLAGRIVVVIDVLRATTTITGALAAGAREVLPFDEINATRRRAEQLGQFALTGGERGGKTIAGFDLGNSPAEYTPDRVAGKSICFTTTNGTRAMHVCRKANRILLGAFVNLSSLCHCLPFEGDWDLVCAGTDGQITREDVLLAGAVIETFRNRAPTSLDHLNDQAVMAADLWQWASRQHDPLGPGQLARLLAQSHGGRNLLEIGQGDDIDWAAELDRLAIVPQLDPHVWRITASSFSAEGN
jgi:2-phosphosulfolactate phosphatase